MKTINVTDEIYDFLSNLSNEIKTQDNRCTAQPYFFQVKEDEEFATTAGCGEEVWVMDGEIHLRTEQDIKEAVFEWKEWTLGDDTSELLYENLTSFEVEDILKENYHKVNVDIRYRYSNSFFTKKACEEHIRINKHNLDNPKSYLFYAYRNTELEMMFKFLNESFNSNQ